MTALIEAFASELETLGWAIADDGIDAHDAAVARLVARMTAAGVLAGPAALVTDPAQPTVSRERAFGLLRADPTAARSEVAAA